MSECNVKHTVLQPTDREWKCPGCGIGYDSGGGGFVIDDSENMECTKLHETDVIRCYKCDYETTGKAFAQRLMKVRNQMVCPHCKGTGVVPKKK
jgi:hypothetical protein